MSDIENKEEKSNTSQTQLVLDNLRISNYITGQRWVTLKGDFTSTELFEIANKIESAYNKAFKNGIENNGNKE